MLVKELIYALEQLNPNAKVIAEDNESAFELHAIAHNGEQQKPIVKLLWQKDVVCECEFCQNEYGEMEFIYNEPCAKCKEWLEEDY